MEAPGPTWTSPISDALGATNASLWTWGVLSKMFMSVRCLETENVQTAIMLAFGYKNVAQTAIVQGIVMLLKWNKLW